VNDDHHPVFENVGRVLLDQVAMPALTEIGHEPQHVAPPSSVARRMGIAFLVAVDVVFAVIGNPGQRRAFARQTTQKRQQPTHRSIGLEAAVREQPVVAHANAQRTGRQDQDGAGNESLPTKVERRSEGQHVDHRNPDHHGPVDASLPQLFGIRCRYYGCQVLGVGLR
jgi:hypothetical protein